MKLHFCLRLQGILLCSLLCQGSLASANSNAAFESRLKRLKESQSQLNRRLKAMGIPVTSNPNLASENGQTAHPDENEPDAEPKPIFQIHNELKGLQAHAGKILFGQLVNRLVVSGEVTPVVVELDLGQRSFSGLRALGRARISGTDKRVALEFDRIVTRPGKVISIQGIGQDLSGAFGLEAQVFSSKAIEIAGAMASSLISGIAASQQTQTVTGLGFNQVEPTGRNALLQGVAQTAADQSKRLIEESTQAKPVLVVEGGTPLSIYLDQEVRF